MRIALRLEPELVEALTELKDGRYEPLSNVVRRLIVQAARVRRGTPDESMSDTSNVSNDKGPGAIDAALEPRDDTERAERDLRDYQALLHAAALRGEAQTSEQTKRLDSLSRAAALMRSEKHQRQPKVARIKVINP